MDRPDIPVVSVFGANAPVEGDEAYQQARAAGRELARLGYAVANGGYAGTMEASFRGAKEAGGATIGVICTLWKSPANRYTDRVIKTRDLFERARTLVELGSAGYVVLPGATGTLVELALVWELTCKRLMARRPIVCLGHFWDGLIAAMSQARPGCEHFIAVVDSPAELPRHFAARGGL